MVARKDRNRNRRGQEISVSSNVTLTARRLSCPSLASYSQVNSANTNCVSLVVPSTRCSLHHWVFQHHDQATGIFLMEIQRAIECTVFLSVTSEGTPVFTFLPEALQGLRTRLIPRQTREKPSHIPSPTTTQYFSLGQSRHPVIVIVIVVVPVPSLCTLSSMSTQYPPLLRTFTIAAHQVCGQTASIFVFLDGTETCCVLSCQSRHCPSLLILLQPVRLCSAILSVIIMC